MVAGLVWWVAKAPNRGQRRRVHGQRRQPGGRRRAGGAPGARGPAGRRRLRRARGGAHVHRLGASSTFSVSNCVAGGACVPANACHKGMFVCNEGCAMTCMELPDLQANGTTCGANKVCNSGACNDCTAEHGLQRDRQAVPRRAASSAPREAPVCTETDNRPKERCAGRRGWSARRGPCVTCQAGAACTPTNKCHTGTLVCSGAAPTCNDANTNVPAGTSCGTDMVVRRNGSCRPHRRRGLNVPGKPCRRGTIACNTGTPVCIESSTRPTAACAAPTWSAPDGHLHELHGRHGLRAGEPVSRRGSTSVRRTISLHRHRPVALERRRCAAPTVSATRARACRARRGPAASRRNACKTGTTSCATGSPSVWSQGIARTARLAARTRFATPAAAWRARAAAPACPHNPCHTGTLNCSTGSATCTDSGSNQPDGTVCGTNLVCRAGSCVSCTAGQACQPTNPCKNGTTSCTTGSMVCAETTNKGAGTLCGAGQSYSGGVLTLPAMCTAGGTCAAAVCSARAAPATPAAPTARPVRTARPAARPAART